jgi:hypothetical protein
LNELIFAVLIFLNELILTVRTNISYWTHSYCTDVPD